MLKYVRLVATAAIVIKGVAAQSSGSLVLKQGGILLGFLASSAGTGGTLSKELVCHERAP